MRYRIWMLVLVLSMGLACAREEKVSDTSPAAAAATPTPPPSYKLTVTFEGLVGYVNSKDQGGENVVWALLPNADPDRQPPPGADATDPAHYVRHHAVLKVSGKNVKGFEQAANLLIPIDGYDIKITSTLPTGTVTGVLDTTTFNQASNSVDKIRAAILSPTPADPRLAARMMVPATNLEAHPSTPKFKDVNPGSPNAAGHCPEKTANIRDEQRIEWVTWTPTLTDDLVLTLSSLKPSDPDHPTFQLTLHPEAPGKDFEIKIVNQVSESLLNPGHHPAHWAAYRWFYNLSNSGADCTKHYYPDGPLGGDRCPQKLYQE